MMNESLQLEAMFLSVDSVCDYVHLDRMRFVPLTISRGGPTTLKMQADRRFDAHTVIAVLPLKSVGENFIKKT